MTKKSRKRDARYSLWGFVSIFGFRNGHSFQKLLTDKKRGSRRLDGAAYVNVKLESTDSCETCNDTNGLVPCKTSTSELSVKELMEEEILGEKDRKKKESNTRGEEKPSTTGGWAYIKNRWMKDKMSLDLDTKGFIAPEELVAGRSGHRKHKSCSSVDLNVTVEELCSRIHQKDTSYAKHGQDGEPTEDPSVFEKILLESTKVLMNHFSDGNGRSKDGKIQHSKELTDALQILNSNQDFFLKLLQDPSSQLVKHIRSSRDIQVEEGKFKLLTGSDTIEQDMANAKQLGFFRRRFKRLESNSSKKTDTSEDISKIVVLKLGLLSSGSSDTASLCSSFRESPWATGDEAKIKRAFFPFSFSEFRRKLKCAMRKEQHGLSHQSSDEQLNQANPDNKISGEIIGMASPTRDHFFIERIPKTPVGIETGKLKADSALTPEQRVSNIYIEAKKHLAENVGSSGIDGILEDNYGKRSRSLGRILAFSGYNSPSCSPKMEGEMRLMPYGECQASEPKTMSQVIQESNVSNPGQVTQESESETWLASDKPILETEVPSIEPSVSNDLPYDGSVDKPIQEAKIPTSEAKKIDLDGKHFSQRESEQLENFSHQFSPECITKSEPVDNPLTCSEENFCPTSLKQGVREENEPSSPSNALMLIFKGTEDFEDLDTMSDATSRPSPISVLDPVFQEDYINPPGMKYSNGIGPIRPRQIQFEEEISVHVKNVPTYRICVDDKYTIKFVKDVVQMSGLTWDELLKRFLFTDRLVDPSLLDEVDFLPELLSCDFNALFDLISEVLIEICCFNFGCLVSLATPYVHPKSKGKDLFTEVWKGVDRNLKLQGPRHTLDQIIEKDLAKTEKWVDLQLDSHNIRFQIQEAIFGDLVEETILSFGPEVLASDFPIPLPAEAESEV